ncbi:MAG: MFS transporter [Acidobacteriales bacterium]|nr:MFS transporter [Terriglobales bacterium]
MAELPNPIAEISEEAWHRHGPALGPLREPLFRALWIASLVSYTGTWMQNLGTGWLMSQLTSSPVLISMVQVCMSLPVFMVGLPAGALADMVDRRKLLLITQSCMVFAAATLGFITVRGLCTPWPLLVFTLLLGIGAVMNDPAWQAITPEVVSRQNFASAVALNSVGFNLARAVGPALAGYVIAWAGSGWAFMLNAASFFGVIIFLLNWERPPRPDPVPLRRMSESLRQGFAHVNDSHSCRAVLIRTGLFSVFASALWALLPLVARDHGSIGYGQLLGSFGLGALSGAGLLPAMRKSHSLNHMFVLATVVFAAAIALLGHVTMLLPLAAVFFVAGASWIAILASLNISAQMMAPAQFRARALSMYLLVLQGGMAAGSAVWGLVAARFDLPTAFLAAAAGLVAGLLTMGRYKLIVRDWGPSTSTL